MSVQLSFIVALAILGLPLFCVLGGVGLAGWHTSGGISNGLGEIYGKLTGAEAVSLSTIPMFTFAGYLMAKAKTAERLVRMSEALLGAIPGGLAMVTVLISALFTVLTGASGVTIVALGGLLMPELIRARYTEKFSIGVVTGSGSVGLLFPPALPLIVYAFIFALNAGQGADAGHPIDFAIDRFYFAGVVPGMLLVGILLLYCLFIGLRTGVERTPVDFNKFLRAAWVAKWELPIPLFIGLMVSGLAHVHEVAALTALYVFVVEVWIYKDVDLKRDLFHVTRESMTLVGAIFMKIAAGILMTSYLIDAQVSQHLFEWVGQHVHEQWLFLLILNVLLLVVGCLMDIFSAIIVVVPLIVPAAAQYHINPYHLGIIFLLNLEIGYLLPPAGLNLFIAAFRFNRPLTELYRAVLPFILLMAIALAIVTYVPKLTVVPKSHDLHIEANQTDLPP